jgi:hypothetical protein
MINKVTMSQSTNKQQEQQETVHSGKQAVRLCVKKWYQNSDQGIWIVKGYTLDKKKNAIELWIFMDDDEFDIDLRVLENNPLQGRWGYTPHVDFKKTKTDKGINPEDMSFFPPKSAKCKRPSKAEEYIHKGTWIHGSSLHSKEI